MGCINLLTGVESRKKVDEVISMMRRSEFSKEMFLKIRMFFSDCKEINTTSFRNVPVSIHLKNTIQSSNCMLRKLYM